MGLTEVIAAIDRPFSIRDGDVHLKAPENLDMHTPCIIVTWIICLCLLQHAI